jgi:hypothetical protein
MGLPPHVRFGEVTPDFGASGFGEEHLRRDPAVLFLDDGRDGAVPDFPAHQHNLTPLPTVMADPS